MFRKYRAVIFIVLLLCMAFVHEQRRSLYVFPVHAFFPEMPLPGWPVTEQGVALGRHLFYDPILSGDSTMSCGSCHKQEAAFSDAPLAHSLGKGRAPQRRNTLPLFNLAWHPSFFWDGRAGTIEAQVFHPVRDTGEMSASWVAVEQRVRRSPFYKQLFRAAYGNVLIDSNLIANAIGQFERTLISYRSKYDRVLLGKDTFTRKEAAGFLLVNDMTKGDCLHCHTTDSDPLGSTFAFSNNGLDALSDIAGFTDRGRGEHTGIPGDNGKFKIPSLRNLVFTAPYMHDGRFSTIEEVVAFYDSGLKISPTIDSKMEFAHHGGAHLSAEEKKQVIAFLLTLSDSTFVTDPAFSNPFKDAKKQ